MGAGDGISRWFAVCRRFREAALRLVESEVGHDPPPAHRRGLATAPLSLTFLCLLPLASTSAVHYATTASMSASMALAVVLSVAVGGIWWPLRDRQRKALRIWACGAIWLLAAAGVTIELLYDPYVHGMPSTGAIDALGHIIEQVTFIDRPRIYDGMLAFHGVAHWIERLGLDTFRAYRLLLYALLLTPVIYAAFVQGALAVALPRHQTTLAATAGLHLASAALGAYPMIAFLLPVLHGYQLDGYYPQLMGLVPLFASALLYAICRHRLQRLLALALGLVLLRFSYLLNFPDLVLIASLVVAIEALTAERGRTQRRVLFVLVAAGLLLSAYLYHTMIGLIAWRLGAIPAPHLAWAIPGTGLLAALLLGLPAFVERCLPHACASLRRLCTFVGSYGLVAIIVQGAWLAAASLGGHTGEERYILLKYAFSAWVLVVATAVPCFAYALVALVVAQARRFSAPRLAGGLAALVTAGAATVFLVHGVPEHYAVTFAWRRSDRPSPAEPLADLAAWRIIERELQKSGRRFGGFFAPSTVETYFAAYVFRDRQAPLPRLDEPTGLPLGYDYPRLQRRRSGDCAFWLPPELFPRYRRAGSLEARRRRAVEALHRGPKQCARYVRSNRPGRPIALCFSCAAPGPPERRDSPPAQSPGGRTR